MIEILCLVFAFILLACFAFELLMLAIVLGLVLLLVGVAYMFISFWFKFLVFLTWPYGFYIIIGVVFLIWLVVKIRK